MVDKTFTAGVQIFDPYTGTEPVLQAGYTYSAGAAGAPIYTGNARIQVMNAQAAADIVGDRNSSPPSTSSSSNAQPTFPSAPASSWPLATRC